MRTRVGCLLLLGAMLVTPIVRADEAGLDLAEAKKQFTAGVNLLDDPEGAKYEDAYHAFKRAYALSRNVKILGNIGFCAMHLERDGEAIEAYSTYLRETPDIDERERAQIQRDLATLSSTIARVRITVQHPANAFSLVDVRVQTRGPVVDRSMNVLIRLPLATAAATAWTTSGVGRLTKTVSALNKTEPAGLLS